MIQIFFELVIRQNKMKCQHSSFTFQHRASYFNIALGDVHYLYNVRLTIVHHLDNVAHASLYTINDYCHHIRRAIELT